MCLYGDPAYPLRIHLQAPYRNLPLTMPMEEFNKSMSAVRISVEWIFGDIINYFKFLDFKKNLKISLSSVGKMYIVASLLRNALTCLQSNMTQVIFFSWSHPLFKHISHNFFVNISCFSYIVITNYFLCLQFLLKKNMISLFVSNF